ncbi:hypothetical protein OH779_06100 [Actinacidiphila glaucinigra]|uniref:hypothetical protein n=1 Tax=Actinacidiphila glaucinigra TaxID=235986 RepID=UPI0038659A1C
MLVWISWSVDPIGSAGATAPDVKEAARLLQGSITRMRRAFDSTRLTESSSTARIMQARMLDQGRTAVLRGEQWSATVGSIRVLLIPRGDHVRVPLRREPNGAA